VRAFHAAALAAGYEDNGAPGERAVYHPGFYGAFVIDLEGIIVELAERSSGCVTISRDDGARDRR
jgi:hypothetical protein